MADTRRLGAISMAAALAWAATGCGGQDAGVDGPAQTGVPAVTVADLTDDLAPRLEQEFGSARLLCGLTDIFGAGLAVGPLQQGNALGCTYLSPMESFESGGAVWVNVLVMMLADDAYAYSVVSGEAPGIEAPNLPAVSESTPEWLYRDGLTCEQLAAPLTADVAPGPDFAQAAGTSPNDGSGLSYPELVYYWFDAGRPDALDPAGDGRPCAAQYPTAEVDAFFDSAIGITPSGSVARWAEPPVTTFDIRTALAGADDLPAGATQVDCSLAGPVADGTVFTCAPRLNREADTRLVAVVDTAGGYLLGPSLSATVRAPEPSPWVYAAGLTCEQIRAPLTEATFSPTAGVSLQQAVAAEPYLADEGLSYFNAIIYALTNADTRQLSFDSEGWPCTDAYPSEDVAEVQGQVQYPGT